MISENRQFWKTETGLSELWYAQQSLAVSEKVLK